MIGFKLSSGGRGSPAYSAACALVAVVVLLKIRALLVADRILPLYSHRRPRKRHRRHRLQPGRPRPSANRLGKTARPARRRGAREQEVVELNSKVPVRDERNKKKKV